MRRPRRCCRRRTPRCRSKACCRRSGLSCTSRGTDRSRLSRRRRTPRRCRSERRGRRRRAAGRPSLTWLSSSSPPQPPKASTKPIASNGAAPQQYPKRSPHRTRTISHRGETARLATDTPGAYSSRVSPPAYTPTSGPPPVPPLGGGYGGPPGYGPPGYGGPPQYGFGPPVPPPNTNVGLIVGIVVGVGALGMLGLVGLGVYAGLKGSESESTHTVQADDGGSQVDAPSSWTRHAELNDRATIRLANTSREEYFIAIFGIEDRSRFEAHGRRLRGYPRRQHEAPIRDLEPRARLADAPSNRWASGNSI